MSCRLELLKRRFVPDVEATHIDGNDEEETAGVSDECRRDMAISMSPANKRARTEASSSNIDFGAIAHALQNAQHSTALQQRSDRFANVNTLISQGEINSYLKAEVSSLRRRKLLPRRRLPADGFSKARSPVPAISDDSEGEGGASTSSSSRLDERKEFSLKDVEMIVQRLLAEQKTRMHYEFENVLTRKLQEQSDAFNSYAQDALKREMESTSERCYSYLS